MVPEKVIAVFDVGKTNKKLLLFNERYELVSEKSVRLPETVDEDKFACEDVHELTEWLINSFEELSLNDKVQLAAINFSGYGASFVHISSNGQPVTPLYNYLKPYPEVLQHKLYSKYGGERLFSLTTASPVLGSLNAGLQLYRIQQEQPEVFDKIRCSLHLPQYLSFVLSGSMNTDITSIGCHTQLWDFNKNAYHDWVRNEGLLPKFAPLKSGDMLTGAAGGRLPIGVGLHYSSAALIPYLLQFKEPFILISTGTWCISMNPFNDDPLTDVELTKDCLCYLTYTGKPVKASRLFAGNDHELGVARIAAHFNTSAKAVCDVNYNEQLIDVQTELPAVAVHDFAQRSMGDFQNIETAYHQLLLDIMHQQVAAVNLVIGTKGVRSIFVDGGFSKNEIYMRLLAKAYPLLQVAAASVPHSTAMGAALAIHKHWNNLGMPENLVKIKPY